VILSFQLSDFKLKTKTGTKIEVISGVSEHGSIVSNLGNIGAILRYNPNYSN